MFNIENHSELAIFVYYGEDYDDAYIASVSCCALGVHSFENSALLGFDVCKCCGHIDAVFALRDSDREDGAGNIYATVRIEDVHEFAGCTTVAECARAAAQVIIGAKRAA